MGVSHIAAHISPLSDPLGVIPNPVRVSSVYAQNLDKKILDKCDKRIRPFVRLAIDPNTSIYVQGPKGERWAFIFCIAPDTRFPLDVGV
jgi:hypothetical protein